MLNAVFLTVVVFVSLPLKTSKHEIMILEYVINVYIYTGTPLVSGLNPALVGLSLTYIISLAGMLQYVVRQSAEVESIVSFHREYINIF